MMNINDKREFIIKEKYDVIVVGDGIAGVAAAVSASRKNCKTILLEKQINLGGLATIGLINWFEPLCDGNGNQVIGGIAEELLKFSIKYEFENLPKQWGGEGKNKINSSRYATYFSPTMFSLALDDYLVKNKVEICFDTMAVYPVMKNNKCFGIVAENV